MHVLFNVEPLLRPPLTGVGQYTRHVLEGLSAHGSGVRVTCVAAGRAVAVPGADAVAMAEAPGGVRGAVRSAAGAVPGARALRAWAQGRRDRGVAAALGGDVYHDPNHHLRPLGCPSVVTIHDLSILHHPGFHPAARVRAMVAAIRHAARHATRITCGAALIRDDIVRTLRVDPRRIDVVPYGVDPGLRPVSDPEVLARHGLVPGGYVLAMGTREPRKNLPRLVEAFLLLPEAVRAGRVLALAGPGGWRSDALEARIDAAGAAVRRLGYVADGERAALYSGAACFAFPSVYEGFGLPPLEAAACGAPVLTSVGTAMAEVMGEAALLVEPGEVGAIAAGLRAILEDEGMAGRLRAAGPARAAGYSWARCVAGTVASYRAAVG